MTRVEDAEAVDADVVEVRLRLCEDVCVPAELRALGLTDWIGQLLAPRLDGLETEACCMFDVKSGREEKEGK